MARIQQAKQIKLERKPSGKTASKSLIPSIARRGLAVLAMIALAAGSAQARTGGAPSGGGAPINDDPRRSHASAGRLTKESH